MKVLNLLERSRDLHQQAIQKATDHIAKRTNFSFVIHYSKKNEAWIITTEDGNSFVLEEVLNMMDKVDVLNEEILDEFCTMIFLEEHEAANIY